MEYVLRLTDSQYQQILRHAHNINLSSLIAVCGQRITSTRTCLSIHTLFPLEPHVPPVSELMHCLTSFARKNMVLLPLICKYPLNGELDFVHRITQEHSSAPLHLYATLNDSDHVVLYSRDPNVGLNSLVCAVGDDIHFWPGNELDTLPFFSERHQQVFGATTTSLLQRLTVAIVGCSGTGSPVIEQLARLGVGKLVLVDPDFVEIKNLNRILNATHEDATSSRRKVHVLAEAVRRMGLQTNVVPIVGDLAEPNVLLDVAGTDVLFGCVDTVEGRHVLNRLATFYSLPYFDIGVGLKANGQGGISQAGGTIHYLQPGGSSLLSRGVYTLDELRAEALKRTNPTAYADQLRSGYVVGAVVGAPAVISVNMQLAAMAVNEFLARLHRYRTDDNRAFAAHRLSLKHGFTKPEPHPDPCPLLKKHVGRGDVEPLLDMPSLTTEGSAK